MKDSLLKLKLILEDIAGQWNGDLPGIAEDRAHAAIEGIEQISKLVEILEELELN